jgi:hypothetical protein
MAVRFLYARHPFRLSAKHPRIIEDLLELIYQGKQEAVNAIILMLEDFYIQGIESRFCKKLQGLPIWELKTRSRGGLKGGARVYFFFLENNRAVLINAEYKADTTASITKLEEVAQVILAYTNGIRVFEEIDHEQKN